MDSSQILILYLVLFALQFAWETLLNILNMRNVRANAAAPPPAFADRVDAATYKKSIDYTITKTRFGIVSSLFSALVLLAVILSGALGYLDDWLGQFQLGTFTHGVIYVFALALLFNLASLPFSLYSTFVIEEKFGFNKMTPKLYILDMLKGLLLSAVLMAPLLYGLFWFMESAGRFWWLYAFLFIAGFQLLMVLLYPTLIAPLFNKFTPLEVGSLRERILEMADKCGFRTSGIFKMDGSKRSKHSNAYFTGFGRSKRIVLFDTLIESLTEPQVVAVLAHEIGHEKKKHIKKMLVLSMLSLLAGLYVLSLLLQLDAFFQAFGFAENSYHAAIVIFGFCAGPFTFFLSPLSSILSRKYEYQADRYAVDATGSAEGLHGALLKLSSENLSNLTPHPWYSFYHYSHPTLAERLAAMDAYAAKVVKA
ncbi:MAG: M48 family metallopeptidase [Deferribacteres bacterium]|nr:M48 family metallopeptidase [Deferribacteres bacterium]